MLRGRDVQDFEDLKRQGLSIRAISRLTGYCRKTVRKCLTQPETVPVYGPRSKQPGRLEPFKPYLEERMRAAVWNARVLLRELRQRGYSVTSVYPRARRRILSWLAGAQLHSRCPCWLL